MLDSKIKSFSLSLGALIFLSPLQLLAAPKVAVSIGPIHSIVAQVTQGILVPDLVLPNGHSPHTYSLTPSSVRKVINNDLIIYVSEVYEFGLKKVLDDLPGNQKLRLLDNYDGLELLTVRKGGKWIEHDHDDEDNELDGLYYDPHIWLSPRNVQSILQIVRDRLIEIDPDNSEKYKTNAQSAINSVIRQEKQISTKLKTITDTGFIVYHDAFQYFEKSFDLQSLGSVVASPDKLPGAKRIVELAKIIRKSGQVCVFSEPQFEPKLVSNLKSDLDILLDVLDPLGASIEPGILQWSQIMDELTNSFLRCLSQTRNEQAQ